MTTRNIQPPTGALSIARKMLVLTRIKRPWPIFSMFGYIILCLGPKVNERPFFDKKKNILFWLFVATISRSFGAMLNDLIDNDLDKFVSRTKFRPLVDVDMSFKIALAIILFMTAIFGSIILLSLFPGQPIFILCFLWSFLTILYSFSKRFHAIPPQLILGIVHNPAIPLHILSYNLDIIIIKFAAIFLHVVILDTAYAMQDINCDKKIGINSLALTLSSKNFLRQFLLYAILIDFCLYEFIGLYYLKINSANIAMYFFPSSCFFLLFGVLIFYLPSKIKMFINLGAISSITLGMIIAF